MSTFADELRTISQNALEKQKREKEERVHIGKENYKKKMSSLMSKYHHVIKKGLLEAAYSGKRQFQLVIDDDEDFVFADAFNMNYIKPVQWMEELLNPDSYFLPLKDDGITRDSFTGIKWKYGKTDFESLEYDYHTYCKTTYDFSW